MATTHRLQGEYRPAVQSRVVFGQGKVDSLREEVEGLGGRRVLVLSGRSVAENTDAVRRVTDLLGDACVGVLLGPDPARSPAHCRRGHQDGASSPRPTPWWALAAAPYPTLPG